MPIRMWISAYVEKYLDTKRCSGTSLSFSLVSSDGGLCVCCDFWGHINFLSVREIQDVAMTLRCSTQLGSVIKTALK